MPIDISYSWLYHFYSFGLTIDPGRITDGESLVTKRFCLPPCQNDANREMLLRQKMLKARVKMLRRYFRAAQVPVLDSVRSLKPFLEVRA
jgi:hypothetical protein